MAGPCGWAVSWDGGQCATSGTDDEKAAAEIMAIGMLWRLTGQVFGVCSETVRPCFGPPTRPSTYRGHDGNYWPGMILGTMAPGPCGCRSGCEHVGPAYVALPGPIQSITSVWADGVLLDSSVYKIKNKRWLVRVDGLPWPRHQDVAAGDHDAGAWTVTYERGTPVPPDGQLALNDLACELLRARLGGACKLPARAQSVARQGVEVQLLDPATLYENGLIGIDSVDRWVSAVNPGRLRSRPRVYSPDAPQVMRLS